MPLMYPCGLSHDNPKKKHSPPLLPLFFEQQTLCFSSTLYHKANILMNILTVQQLVNTLCKSPRQHPVSAQNRCFNHEYNNASISPRRVGTTEYPPYL